MTDIKLTDEQLQQIQQAMDEGGDITLSFSKPEPEQWEPKSGPFTIYGNNDVRKGAASNDYRLAGNERLTREQAVLDAKAKRIFDRQLAYRAEFAPMYTSNSGWYVYQNDNDEWLTSVTYYVVVGMVCMPKQIAEGLVVKLNAGTVVF